MPNEFKTMREIAKLFAGQTSHKSGNKLKALGLRTPDGKPSSVAFDRGFVSQRWTEDHQHYCSVWHLGRTVPLLENAGLVRTAPDAP